MATSTFFVPSELLPDPALLVSVDGIIQACNNAFAALCGVSPGALPGTQLESLAAEQSSGITEYLRACARSEQPLAGLLALRSAAGISKHTLQGIADHWREESTSPRVALLLHPAGESSDTSMLTDALAKTNAEIARRAQIEDSLRRERETLEVTLASIGDAVIATDAVGRVTFLNPVAERLTGWPLEEARSQPFERVFRIVNEYSGRPVENPVAKVLQSGGIVGLANHTVLITRDGRRVPIDDSGAPVRLARGELIGIVVVFRDVTERKRADLARAWLAAIVEGSEDAIVSKTLDGIVTSWNPGATRVFGYEPAEIIGRPVTTIIPLERHSEETEMLTRLRRGERVDHYETVRLAKDGRRIDVSLTVSPMTDEGGAIVGASKIARDITERKRTEYLPRESDRRKDEFLATLAHELRNPLAPIRTVAELFKRTEGLAPELLALTAILERQTGQMTHLVDDLLDVSRITSGRIHLKRESVELTELLKIVVETYGERTETVDREVTFSPSAERIYVDGDRVRLTQVFSNILHNAMKYTPSGGRVDIALRKENDEAVVSIRDNGVGIPPEMLDHIFELFAQLHRSYERTDGGLGIGLTLAKKLTELHDGRIEARSAGPGQGSEFLVRLPVSTPKPVQEDAAPSGRPDLSVSRRVLIADDNRDAAVSLSVLLQAMGHETRIAHDGLEAVEEAEVFQPEVVLLDIGMPKLDGYETARRIASRPWASSTRIVAVTGWGQDADRQRASEAGFHEHLVKPVDPDTLRQVVLGNGHVDLDSPR
jgi:PAS domain S-box-containing protein